MPQVFKTALTELTGCTHPVMCGGMHYVGFAELVAAVANAGGFACITALTQETPEDLRKEIRKCRTLTDKPIGVNITLLPVMRNPDYEGYIKVCIEEGIKCVETAGSNPDKYVKLLKDGGVKVIHKCTAIRHAEKAIRCGVDMLSMDGFECGGHPGSDDVTNWVLIPKACKKLKIPIIVSGACATGSQLAAALAFGAHGINMGTRFIAVKESPVLPQIKDAIVAADERDTALVMRSVNNTERVFKNKTTDELLEKEHAFPGDFEQIREYVAGINYRKSFYETGDPTSSVWSCGQSLGLIDSVPSCQELIDTIVQEACESMANAQRARL